MCPPTCPLRPGQPREEAAARPEGPQAGLVEMAPVGLETVEMAPVGLETVEVSAGPVEVSAAVSAETVEAAVRLSR